MRTNRDFSKLGRRLAAARAPLRGSGATAITSLTLLFLAVAAAAQTQATAPSSAAPLKPAYKQFYQELSQVGLDADRIYHVRDAGIEREDIHISLQDGTIGFTQSVEGRVTGAFFEGYGEILMIPPNQAERASLALFTHAAVLEERFTTAYFRFSDDVQQELAGSLRPESGSADFLQRWDAPAKELAERDALRLLAVFNNGPETGLERQRFFHARLSGVQLGTFDVLLDTGLREQILVAQTGYAENNIAYYDTWMSFPMRSARRDSEGGAAPKAERPPGNAIELLAYKIRARVEPPHRLQAEAEVVVRSPAGGQRVLLLELSRFLKVGSVRWQEGELEFLQNAAIPGSQLARRGNDVMAVLLPRPLLKDESVQLTFQYEGDVLTEAGGGLMYVGARGEWYPNRGPAMAQFDLEFHVPERWSLLATGKKTQEEIRDGEQVTHWISERPIPIAGFNLGQYVSRQEQVEGVTIATFAARGVENQLLRLVPQTTSPPAELTRPNPGDLAMPAPAPSPTEKLRPLEERAQQTFDFYSQRLGAYPYSSLLLTQRPGADSQGWPGLIFLSSFSFLSPQERAAMPGMNAEYENLVYDQLMPAHEIAHQWWGDSVIWKTYHDQWLMEALANYMALMQIESAHPEQFRKIMERYRRDLLQTNTSHRQYLEAGPVTLGGRLSSSQFPDGYDVVAYERGSWLLHMLRCMLRDATRGQSQEGTDAAFLELLRQLQRRYAGSALSTGDLQHAVEEIWPARYRYENQRSLDWFFEGWVNGTVVPSLKLKDVRIQSKRDFVYASGAIEQNDAPGDLVTLLPIYAQSADGSLTLLTDLFADGAETSFYIPVPAGTKRLLLDPKQTVLSRP